MKAAILVFLMLSVSLVKAELASVAPTTPALNRACFLNSSLESAVKAGQSIQAEATISCIGVNGQTEAVNTPVFVFVNAGADGELSDLSRISGMQINVTEANGLFGTYTLKPVENTPVLVADRNDGSPAPALNIALEGAKAGMGATLTIESLTEANTSAFAGRGGWGGGGWGRGGWGGGGWGRGGWGRGAWGGGWGRGGWGRGAWGGGWGRGGWGRGVWVGGGWGRGGWGGGGWGGSSWGYAYPYAYPYTYYYNVYPYFPSCSC